ncbi:MAG: RlmE family RNA methyltransferase [SAR86 cluster bacterium]|nr:RlmE family RNA methyltransferase [SAR86 cluster bacterium]
MTKSSKAIYKKADTFSKLAKTHGYRSRSAIKLLEIQKKDNFIKPHAKVLDLGSSPGGWSQVSNEIVGKNGLIFGVDKKIMQPLKSVHFVNKGLENLCESDFEVLNENILPFDVVLSDIAPNISGIRDRDNALMDAILIEIRQCIDNFLKVNGTALCKVFHGENFDKLMIYMKTNFQKVKIRKPDSSRANSKETYILGVGKKK